MLILIFMNQLCESKFRDIVDKLSDIVDHGPALDSMLQQSYLVKDFLRRVLISTVEHQSDASQNISDHYLSVHFQLVFRRGLRKHLTYVVKTCLIGREQVMQMFVE